MLRGMSTHAIVQPVVAALVEKIKILLGEKM
jgi:hypothetical protein